MTTPGGIDFQERDLEIGDRLGAGGQGEVLDLCGAWDGFVYKRYLWPNADARALLRLVEFPGRVSVDERERLMLQTAWPWARVLDGGQVRGCLMRKVPPVFWGMTAAGKPQLRELQYLLYEPRPMWGDIAPLEIGGRLEIARQAAALFDLVHRKGLVIGDVSMSNLLWSPRPLALFLIDCDGFRAAGAPPVFPQGETVDWEDPYVPSTGQDLDSDRYKLALLVGRVLARDPGLRPGGAVVPVGEVPERVAVQVPRLFAEAGGPRGTRPSAGQWIRALSDRGEIDLPPLPPVRPMPNLPKAPLDGRAGGRQMIPLRPPRI